MLSGEKVQVGRRIFPNLTPTLEEYWERRNLTFSCWILMPGSPFLHWALHRDDICFSGASMINFSLTFTQFLRFPYGFLCSMSGLIAFSHNQEFLTGEFADETFSFNPPGTRRSKAYILLSPQSFQSQKMDLEFYGINNRKTKENYKELNINSPVTHDFLSQFSFLSILDPYIFYLPNYEKLVVLVPTLLTACHSFQKPNKI